MNKTLASPLSHRSLRTQHGPGLSGPRRAGRSRVRVLHPAAAGPARFPAGRRASRRCSTISRRCASRRSISPGSSRPAASRRQPARLSRELSFHRRCARDAGRHRVLSERAIAAHHRAAAAWRSLSKSRIINILHFQTLIASKAARMVLARKGKSLADFGLRIGAWRRGRIAGGARELHRRLCRRGQCAGRRALRHPDRRHDGAFVRADARRRDARPSRISRDRGPTA